MKKSNWGKGIAFTITLFVIGILSMVSYFISLDYYLVSNEYYDDGVEYQETIDSRNRSALLQNPVLVVFDEKTESLKIVFPTDLIGKAQGYIELYRPNDPTLDQEIPLSVNTTGSQIIPLSAMVKGKWHLKIYWTMDDKNYLEEKTIMI